VKLLDHLRAKFRPDMDAHLRLREEAEDVKQVAKAVQEKRSVLENQFPEREFPVAGLIQRRRQEYPR
jgi:hypothetical protein